MGEHPRRPRFYRLGILVIYRKPCKKRIDFRGNTFVRRKIEKGAMEQKKPPEQFKDSDYTTVLTLTFEDKAR